MSRDGSTISYGAMPDIGLSWHFMSLLVLSWQ